MLLRSLLFAPGDSHKKMEKAFNSPTDAIIFDIEDSVAPEKKAEARQDIAAFMSAHPDRSRQKFVVRVNPLDTEYALPDLAAVVRAAPDGILLPKCNGAEDVLRLSHYLDALEAQAGLAPGHVKILSVVSETARAFFSMGVYLDVSPRLIALTWGAEDLATALQAASNRDASGAFTLTFQMARSLCLAGAHAAKAAALETAYLDYRNPEGLRDVAVAGRREGFSGMLAIHPDQVPVINAAFSPSPEDIAHAQEIVDLFAANPGKGTVGLRGKMVDIPHLKQAQQVLATAAHLKAAGKAS